MLFLFMICTFRVGFNDGGMGFDTYLLTDDILLEICNLHPFISYKLFE